VILILRSIDLRGSNVNFDVVGPFVITRHGPNNLIDTQSYFDLRQEADDKWEGLSSACGCYVFAIRAGKGFTPFYVGQACATRLVAEAMNASNCLKYNRVLPKRGKPVIFLLPMMTTTGRLRKRPKSGKLLSVDFLEKWLIATCLVKNPHLLNNMQTRLLKKLHVTGVLNAKQGASNGASSAFKRAIF
jgi:hypothetical protein